MDGSVVFAKWRQRAPHYNRPTCVLGPTRVHITNDISIGSAVFAQLMAECPILYNGPPLPLKSDPSHRGPTSNRLRGSVGPPEPNWTQNSILVG